MRRGQLLAVIGGGLLLLAVAVAAVALGLGRSPEAAVVPSADAGAPEAPAADPTWAFVSLLPPGDGRAAYVVQAGILGDDRPWLDIEVPWAIDPEVEIGREPAVAHPANGAVVYVSDDGTSSTVAERSLDDPEREAILGSVDDSVWDVAVAPDGSVAYLALASRTEPVEDRGVVRMALDGSGAVDVLLPPAGREGRGGIRTVAILAFRVTLDLSRDGRYLARTVCDGPAGCSTEIVELASGERIVVDDASLHDVGLGGVMLTERCGNVDCRAELVDLRSGARSPIPGMTFEMVLASQGDEPMLVALRGRDGRRSVVAIDPQDGRERELYLAPEGAILSITERDGLRWSFADGVVLVTEAVERPGPGATAAFDEQVLVIELDGSGIRVLPPPAIRQLGPRLQG